MVSPNPCALTWKIHSDRSTNSTRTIADIDELKEFFVAANKVFLQPAIQNSQCYKNFIYWNLPKEISQQYLGDRNEKSVACALIGVQLSSLFYCQGLLFPTLKTHLSEVSIKKPFRIKDFGRKITHVISYLPPQIMHAIVNAIQDGNSTMDLHAVSRLENENENFVCGGANDDSNMYTVKEAIELMGNQMKLIEKSEFITGDFTINLYKMLKRATNKIRHHKKLSRISQYFFLMGADKHCTLFVYQPKGDTLAFFDPSLTDKINSTPLLAECQGKHPRELCSFLSARFKNPSFSLYWIMPKKTAVQASKHKLARSSKFPKLFAKKKSKKSKGKNIIT